MKWYNKLLKWGFNSNYWIWFHILAGGILAKLINIFLNNWLSVLIVSIIAIIWEIYEYFKDDVVKIYGSIERFWYDAIGDVLGAIACAILVVI